MSQQLEEQIETRAHEVVEEDVQQITLFLLRNGINFYQEPLMIIDCYLVWLYCACFILSASMIMLTTVMLIKKKMVLLATVPAILDTDTFSQHGQQFACVYGELSTTISVANPKIRKKTDYNVTVSYILLETLTRIIR